MESSIQLPTKGRGSEGDTLSIENLMAIMLKSGLTFYYHSVLTVLNNVSDKILFPLQGRE
jgi:hypothetical protein